MAQSWRSAKLAIGMDCLLPATENRSYRVPSVLEGPRFESVRGLYLQASPWSFLPRRLDEFEEDVRFVTDDPAVMTRVDDRDVPRTEFHLGPVVHADALPAGDEDLDVTSLAALSADGRLDVR